MNILRGKLCEVKQLVHTSLSMASGRWYPQPEIIVRNCSTDSVPEVSKKLQNLDKNKIAPCYVTSKKDDGNIPYELVPYKKDKNGRVTMRTSQRLFEDSLKKSEISYEVYEKLSKEERDIYMAHLKAIEDRALTYKDPKTGYIVMTVSQHLYKAKCCGNACRHCPYNQINATEEAKKSKKWNGAFYY
uniref:PET domain-containing protein n=1 Tax=Strongyloides papillosus TaxID=174720 RepID=A0A0N5C361_STREA